MAEKTNAKGWTEAEKIGLLFQIIAKSGPIPWPELTLPEGRTLKACQVMVDKEKQKVKKLREESGEAVKDPTTSPKKRKAKGKAAADDADAEDDEEAVPTTKKAKKGSKKGAKVKAVEDSEEPVKESE